MSKEITKNNMFMLLIFLGVGILFIFGSSVMNQQFGNNKYFQVPEFGYVQCVAASGSPVSTNAINIPKDGRFVSCPINSKTCDISVSSSDQGLFSDRKSVV